MRVLELKIPPVAVFLVAGAGMWLLSKVTPTLDFALPYAVIVAAVIAAAGLLVAISGVRHFHSVSTTVNPMKPDEASSMVSSGVYRFTRNPMYLGLAACVLAWGIFLQNVAAILCLVLFVAYMTQFQIKPEERALQSIFGDEYSRYRSQVRRWI
jgi:protein-S-isoprenylcysteine O-methyltransferase Ste14